MARLFTPKIAAYYEDYYKSKGVEFIQGTVVSSFEIDSAGKVKNSPAACLLGVLFDIFYKGFIRNGKFQNFVYSSG